MERTGRSLAFGIRLKGMRNAAGLRAKDVAERHLNCSESLVYSIEGGYRTIAPASLEGLLKGPYRRPDLEPYMATLLGEILSGADHPIKDSPATHPNVMLVHELEAESTAAFGMVLDQIPKLAQTPDYMKTQYGVAGFSADEIDGLTAAGLQRQKRFFDMESPPHTSILVTEGALARGAVIPGQLELLLERSNHKSLTIRVVPTGIGPHPVFCSFTIMDFDEFPGILWSDSPIGGSISDKESEVNRARDLWVSLLYVSVGPKETQQMIRHHIQ